MPCPAQAKKIAGMAIKHERLVIQPFVIGYLVSNLSPIRPANRLLVKPHEVRIRAFKTPYVALYVG